MPALLLRVSNATSIGDPIAQMSDKIAALLVTFAPIVMGLVGVALVVGFAFRPAHPRDRARRRRPENAMTEVQVPQEWQRPIEFTAAIALATAALVALVLAGIL